MANLNDIKGGKKSGKTKAPKQAKVKLSKEQALFLKNFSTLENRIKVCQEMTQLWTQFFVPFAGDVSQKQFTPQQEKDFLTLMTRIARRHFEFEELMGDMFTEGKGVMNVLSMAVSLRHMQVLYENENTRDKFEGDWHNVLIAMNKGLGRLLRHLPGNLPLAQALAFMQWDAKQPKNEKKPDPLEKRVKAFKQLLKDQGKAQAVGA